MALQMVSNSVRSIDWVAKNAGITGDYAKRLIRAMEKEKTAKPISLSAKVLVFNLKKYLVN